MLRDPIMRTKRKPKNNEILLISAGGVLAAGLVYLLFKPKTAEAKEKPTEKNDTAAIENNIPSGIEEDIPYEIEETSDTSSEPEEAVQEENEPEVTPTPTPTPTPTKAKQHWILDGNSVPAPRLNDTKTKLITMGMPGSCDLTATGKYRGPRVGYSPKILVIHWGGSDLNNLCATFQSSYPTSSNVGTGRDSRGNPVILQFLDLNAVAWHAGEWRNELSIGIDIAQDPTKDPSFYTNKGYQVRMMNNTTGRGLARCLTIDPVVKKATQDAIVSLCDLFGIPLKIPRGVNGEQDSGPVYYGKLDDDFIRDHFTGVLGHFHTSNNKWDIAPWWEEVMLPILTR